MSVRKCLQRGSRA